MQFENNWKQKSLESLEKHIWPAINPEEESYLVATCHSLRKKPLQEFSIEDLRIMIGQNIGLKFIIPLAIEELEKDILAEGDHFEGDLLKNVLNSQKIYWESEMENWKIVCALFDAHRKQLEEVDTIWEIRKAWFDSYAVFRQYHRSSLS